MRIKPQKHKKTLIGVGALIFAVGLFVSGDRGWGSAPSRLGFYLLSVAHYGLGEAATRGEEAISSFKEFATLKQERRKLAQELREARLKTQQAEAVEKENKTLRRLLGFARKKPWLTVSVKIIGRDPQNLFTGLIVNKGRNNGLDQGMPVTALVAETAVVVGRVAEVGPFSAKISTVFDLDNYLAVRTRSASYHGLARGQGKDGLLKMTYVDRRAAKEVKIGELIETSGENSVFPAGLIVGRVTAFVENQWESYMSLDITTGFAPGKLDYLMVIKSAGD